MLIWVNFGVTSVYFGLLFLTAFLGCRRSFLVLLYLLKVKLETFMQQVKPGTHKVKPGTHQIKLGTHQIKLETRQVK